MSDPPTQSIRLIGRQFGPGVSEKANRTSRRQRKAAGSLGKQLFMLIVPRLHEYQIARAQGEVDGDAELMLVLRWQPDVVEVEHRR